MESGLNDGICVPIVVLLLGLAVDTQIEGGTVVHVARVVVEAIGIGLIVGLALTWLTTLMLRFAERRGWISEHWVEILIVALAAACFTAAQAFGGSGFIACFVGGLLLSGLGARHKEELLRGAEHMGEALALLTWVVFGGIVVARMIEFKVLGQQFVGARPSQYLTTVDPFWDHEIAAPEGHNRRKAVVSVPMASITHH